MKVSCSKFFLLLLFVKFNGCRSVLSEQIPEHWKKYPIQKAINNQKNVVINNHRVSYPLSASVPILKAIPIKKQILKPVVKINIPIVSPKLHNHINPINEILSKNNKEYQPEKLKPREVLKSENKKDDATTTEELDETTNTVHNKTSKIFVNANAKNESNNKQTDKIQLGHDPKIYPNHNTNSESEKTKQARKIEHSRTDSHKSIPENLDSKSKVLKTIYKQDQMHKNNNENKLLNLLNTLTNNSSKNPSGNEVDTKNHENDINQKSNIEIVINHDTSDDIHTQDPVPNVVIHNEDYEELISGNKDEDFSYQNQQYPTYNIPNCYGQFTTNQYTNSLSDEENYGRLHQLATNTRQNNKYNGYGTVPFYGLTQYKAYIVPHPIKSNVGHVGVNHFSNANQIWRSLRNSDVIIRNPSNINLFLNYGGSGNKMFNQRHFINGHADYKHLNHFRPYYPRYVYNRLQSY